LPSIAIFKVK